MTLFIGNKTQKHTVTLHDERHGDSVVDYIYKLFITCVIKQMC